MRYQYLRWIKITLTVLLMILAGILYSCSRQEAGGLFSDDPQSGVLLLEQERADRGTSGDLQMIPEPTGSGDGSVRSSSGPEGEGAGAAAESDTCFVHICGAVAHPGVYELPKGSRIYQAVEMAGGTLPEADESHLNLASMIADGMQIVIYTKEEAETAPSGTAEPGTVSGGTVPSKIDINTAGKEELMTLKGIGESRAEAIITYRQEHGRFQTIEDIMQVPGIKDGAFQKIKEDITV